MSYSPGIAVPIGGIEAELGRLWEESGESKTRASLINLAIYSEEPGSLKSNADIIQELAGDHAMRAILIQADPTAGESSAHAWINMNCYVRGSQGGEVCNEQISFQLAGEAARSLQSVVFSHLDSDLPLVLWWQADFHPSIDGKLWQWVDRLLFDSRNWTNPKQQFDLVKLITEPAEVRTVLCDLNWTRSLPVRQALAGIFDSPTTLPELQKIKAIHLDYAPGHRSTALLVIGWLADRLGWQLILAGYNPQFQDARGEVVVATLEEVHGSSISRILLNTETTSFEVKHVRGHDLYVTTATVPSTVCVSRMARAPREGIREILLAELARGGRHPFYSGSVKAVEALW